jgi:transposase
MSQRRFFSEEFKREAVSLVVDQGYSFAEAGRSLGIRGNLVGRWKRELESGGITLPRQGQLTAEQQRIRELEAENRRLKMEKDILKKATAFFVQEKP